jgi:hypothetical protein
MEPTPVKPEDKINAPDSKVKPASKEKKSILSTLLLIFLLLSVAGNGVLGWLFWTEKNRANTIITEKETIIVERDNVKNDLVQLQTDYGSLKTNNKKIQADLDEKKEQIAGLIEEADKHKGDAYYISKLKKETATLRTIMQGYIHTIDSINTQNKTLLKENIKVRTQYLSETEKANELTKEKEDLQGVINTGSILKASGTKASGVSVRDGGKKESETKKARKSDKIKVTLTIGENSLAKKGNREVYLRVLTPDGKELARALDDANSFSFNGVRGFFCARQTISYDNKEIPVTLYAEDKNKFIPGKYIIEVYCEQNRIGQTAISLE